MTTLRRDDEVTREDDSDRHTGGRRYPAPAKPWVPAPAYYLPGRAPAGATKVLVPCATLIKLLAILLLLTSSVHAQDATEARMARLVEELRCLVCQNQTLEDSNADLAKDLRNEIRAQIEAGKSDEQILDFLVQRYGEFVLYKPRLHAETALLWFGPILLLLAGGAALIITLRRRNARVEASAPDTHQQAMALLNDDGRRS